MPSSRLSRCAPDSASRTTAEFGDGLELGLGLDAFGDHVDVEGVGEAEDRSDDGARVSVHVDAGGEAPVDLQDVEVVLAQAAERRVAGAEVVEGGEHPDPAEGSQIVVGALARLEHRRLGHLDDHAVRADAGLGDEVRESERVLGVCQFSRRDVHRDRDVGCAPRALPPAEVVQRELGDEHAELDDLPVFFRDRDEVRRRTESPVGFGPPSEGLERQDPLVARRHDRLMMGDEFSAFDRAGKLATDVAMGVRDRTEIAIEQPDFGAGFLRRVHGDIGSPDVVACVDGGVTAEHGDADARAAVQTGFADGPDALDRPSDAFGEPHGIGLADVWGDHEELIATESTDGVGVAGCEAQRVGDAEQDLVARFVPIGVVESLKRSRSM